MGLFLNYSADSLTYTNSVGSTQSGQKQHDRILSDDLSIGVGLTDRWDFGVSAPGVLSQSVQDSSNASVFSQKGLTEVKANTKYKFWGDDTRGVAGILSINKNLIENNPFSGSGAGPTFNFEIAADTILAKNWATAINVGYRKRNPGDQIPNVPFAPLKDQWIYSAAASYLVEKFDTKVIFEIYGSRVAEPVSQSTDRSMNALEALLGAKHDFTHNMAGHFGATTQLDSSLGGPEWRVYAGINYALGPVCRTASVSGGGDSRVYQLDVEVLFANDKDIMDVDAVGELNEFFADLMKKGFKKIEISGHTDSVGSREHNIDLSQRRAANVRKYLIEKFKLDPKKIESAGFGPDMPVANNGNYQGRHKNRRVEFKVWQ